MPSRTSRAFAPRVPESWAGFTVHYRHGETPYRIEFVLVADASAIRVELDIHDVNLTSGVIRTSDPRDLLSGQRINRHMNHRSRQPGRAGRWQRGYSALSLLMLLFATAVVLSIAAYSSCAWALSFCASGFRAATALGLRS